MQRSRCQLFCSADRKQASRCHWESITPQPQSPFTLICLSEILFLNQGSVIFMIPGTLKSKISVTEMPSLWLSSRWADAKIWGIWDRTANPCWWFGTWASPCVSPGLVFPSVFLNENSTKLPNWLALTSSVYTLCSLLTSEAEHGRRVPL